ncbi:MAG TPA: hypothetical protein VFF54_01490 [Thermodesulfobacteriota bacterium]|nr:hypothetical protein [Thermodesulfobacteriota bacterium]
MMNFLTLFPPHLLGRAGWGSPAISVLLKDADPRLRLRGQALKVCPTKIRRDIPFFIIPAVFDEIYTFTKKKGGQLLAPLFLNSFDARNYLQQRDIFFLAGFFAAAFFFAGAFFFVAI